MKFKLLTSQDLDLIKKIYKDFECRKEAQEKIASIFGVNERTVRNWANKLELGLSKANVINTQKILIYDIETSRIPAMVWWTGKQYISHDQLKDEAKIISIAYKWLGDDKITVLTWDENHDDRNMLVEFLKVYNSANMVVGQNNDNFDNRWINARAAKHNLPVNTFVRSFDIQKEAKRLFRLPSYSMKYIAKFFGLELKGEHEGIIMWDKIQSGNAQEQKEYLKKMCDYNKQDIVVTEEMFLYLRKYMGQKTHFGVLNGEAKWTCPASGSKNIKLLKTTVTPAGTIQRIMYCNDSDITYKITNKQYMEFLEYKIKENIPLNVR